MTYEEAITVLHVVRMNYICSGCDDWKPKIGNSPRECPMYSHCYNVQDALADAIEALEKQTPKKPHEATTRYDEFIRYECPVCGGFLIKNYPYKCGKMIDWSEEE